jgi:DNA topoisomerase-1
VAGRKRRITQVLGEVAHYLGNTATVARTSYVHPRVIDKYLAGETVCIPASRHGKKRGRDCLCIQGPTERAVLGLLEGREQRLASAARALSSAPTAA